MTSETFSLDDFMSSMGYEFNPDDVEMSLPRPAHLDITSLPTPFDMSFYSQFPQLEHTSNLALDAPGPSGSQEGSISGPRYLPTVEWFPKYEVATGSNTATFETSPMGLDEYYLPYSTEIPVYESATGSNVTMPATLAVVPDEHHHFPDTEDEIPDYEHAAGSNVATSATPHVVLHEYYRLPGTEDETLDGLLQVSEDSKPGRKTFKCTSPGCTSAPFTGKCQAYTHVCKHLNIKKLYGCVACCTKFSTRGAAKRHCESQQTYFSCSICQTMIKRKDYWRKHERICATKN